MDIYGEKTFKHLKESFENMVEDSGEIKASNYAKPYTQQVIGPDEFIQLVLDWGSSGVSGAEYNDAAKENGEEWMFLFAEMVANTSDGAVIKAGSGIKRLNKMFNADFEKALRDAQESRYMKDKDI